MTHVCVEDIAARTIQRARRWNESFSPLEVGKQWSYDEIRKQWKLLTLQGWETKEIRDRLGLRKNSNKTAETWDAHCVDAWCLAYSAVDGDLNDNEKVFCIEPFQIKRRTLHRQLPQKGGKRPRFGGTMHLGLAKNTLVRHVKYGLGVICGHQKNGIALQPIMGGKRICVSTPISKCKILTRQNFRYRWETG